MGLFDNENESAIADTGQTGDGVTPVPLYTPAAPDASPDAGGADEYFHDLNPVQQSMAVKTGLVSNVNGSPQTAQQPDSTEAAPESSSPAPAGPRPAPTPRKPKPEMVGGDVEQGTTPFNPPYDPESEAVRGKGGMPLSPDLKQRIRERLKGTPFENIDMDSLKLHRGYAPWFTPSFAKAMTLENHIYSLSDEFDPENNPEDFNILVEEAVHAGQFQYGDMTRAGYLWESLHGYDENKYEKEAKGIAYPETEGNSTTQAPKVQERDLQE